MLEPSCTEPDLPALESDGETPGFSRKRRLLLKHLALGVVSMTGIVGLSHALHRDPQLSAALSDLALHLPSSRSKLGPDGGDTSSSSSALSSQFDPTNYREFLATIPLRRISIHQVVRCHFKTRGTVSNQLPPRELWPHIVPTLLLADELGSRLDVRLQEITSAYRSPEYNAQIQGAAEGSYHIRNQALDLKFDCPVSRVAEVAHQMREEKLFKGGIGIYPTFLHLDTRGKNVDWTQTPPSKA